MASPICTTPGLSTIPTELLDGIASYLDCSALLALSLSCKSGNVSANIVLYRTYVNLEPPAKAPMYLFLRTICERPDFAEKVREVNVRGWRFEYEVAIGAAWKGMTIQSEHSATQQERKGPLYANKDKAGRTTHVQRTKIFLDAAVMSGLITRPKEETIPALKKSAVWYTSLKEDADLIRLIGRGVEDAHALLMIGLLPRLQVLQVDGLSPYPLLDWHHFLSRSTTALRALRSLSIYGSTTKISEPSASSTLQFLDMTPSLECLELGDIAIKGHHLSIAHLPSKTLSRICCMNAAMELRLLAKRLSGQRIVRLLLVPGPRQTNIVSRSTFSLSDIMQLISASKSTLTHLVLYPIRPSTEATKLREFDRVQNLESVLPGLLDMVPGMLDPETIANGLRKQIPKLTELSLHYLSYQLQTKIVLEQLTQIKVDGLLPALELVRLHFDRSEPSFANVFSGLGFGVDFRLPDIEQPVREDVGELFSKAGIKLEMCVEG
ncbi:hypothetical protein IAQ61_008239 [Plenodomus lingam]|nr:hypothetical protein IAQ61_008239 [Plenodomus lingam]